MGKQSSNLRSVALLMAGAVLIAAFAATPVHAQAPVVFQVFFGTVEIDGQPAPAGASIEGRGTNVATGIEGNPITTTEAGKYGGPLLSNVKLIVQGNISDSSAIEFYVNGAKAECAVPEGSWQSSYPFKPGIATILNLRVGQASTPTPTPTSTPSRTPTAMRVSPTPRASSTATPNPTRTPAPGSSPTPGSIAPTATEAAGTPNATPTFQVTQPVSPSSTPDAAAAQASPTLTASAGQQATATAPAAGTPEPLTPAATAAAGTRSPATLVAKAPVATPRTTSAPILGSGATPAAAPATATPGAISSILPWAGGGLLLIAAVLGLVFGLRLRKSGRTARDPGEQP